LLFKVDFTPYQSHSLSWCNALFLCLLDSQTVASVENEETESEVTEQTKSEDAKPIATETDAPVVAPEGVTDETTEAALKVDAIVAESNETEVVEKETTDAPMETDVAAESTSEAPSVAVSSESADDVTTGVFTSPATLPEVAVETGSGAVAKENATTGMGRLLGPGVTVEGNCGG